MRPSAAQANGPIAEERPDPRAAPDEGAAEAEALVWALALPPLARDDEVGVCVVLANV